MSRSLAVLLAVVAPGALADDLPTLAGPAMGTTYRVTLAADIPGMSRGEAHREVERLLGRFDRVASTWRDDSDASRFNRAAAGEWVGVDPDFVDLVEIARTIHDRTGGAFDITVAPLVRAWQGVADEDAIAAALARVGMQHVESRRSPPALRKLVSGVEFDLGGIGPGYAVDRVGDRLVELGSAAHLVEIGGEVRAWGARRPGEPWRVRLRGMMPGSEAVVELAAGEALATASRRAGRSPIDPRSGRLVKTAATTATIRAASCAEADARAVAALVLGAEEETAPMAGRLSTHATSGER